MARYIDADKLIEELKLLEMFITGMLCGKTLITEAVAEYKKSALRLIDEQPTADVATKSEVVREVIEFIENKIKAMEDHTPTDELDKAIGLVSWILLGVVDQLKKKYTEEME